MPKNTQIDAYRGTRPPKQHQTDLLELIASRLGDPRANIPVIASILDIGCASGAFLRMLKERFPDSSLHGFDLAPDLVEAAKTLVPEATVTVGDALSFEPATRFDAAIASGVLSIFDEYEGPLLNWLSWLRPGGRLFVFGRFNSRDIDTRVQFRNHTTNSEWEGGLTSFSIGRVRAFLQDRGFETEVVPFQLDVDLSEQKDPIRTWTVKTTDGARLVVNGANLIAEQFFLIVKAP